MILYTRMATVEECKADRDLCGKLLVKLSNLEKKARCRSLATFSSSAKWDAVLAWVSSPDKSDLVKLMENNFLEGCVVVIGSAESMLEKTLKGKLTESDVVDLERLQLLKDAKLEGDVPQAIQVLSSLPQYTRLLYQMQVVSLVTRMLSLYSKLQLELNTLDRKNRKATEEFVDKILSLRMLQKEMAVHLKGDITFRASDKLSDKGKAQKSLHVDFDVQSIQVANAAIDKYCCTFTSCWEEDARGLVKLVCSYYPQDCTCIAKQYNTTSIKCTATHVTKQSHNLKHTEPQPQ